MISAAEADYERNLANAIDLFHLLATDGNAHVDRDHVWHMDTLARICRHDEELLLVVLGVCSISVSAFHRLASLCAAYQPLAALASFGVSHPDL